MTDLLDAPTARTATSLTDKIAKLLNQAERAGTEAESATFMAKAQELAAIYSIDLAKARHATIAKERTTPVQRTVTLGVRGTRGLNTLVSLFSGICAANDLTMDIAANSTRVFVFGFAEDIDIAEALFASLSVQLAQAAEVYRKDGSWKNETVYRPGRYQGWNWVEGTEKPITWLSARLDFQAGFASQIGRRLAEARREAENAARTADAEAPTSTGTDLVLVNKRKAVSEFYQSASTARGSYRGGRRATSSAARGAGSRAGDRASLNRATGVGGARKALA